MLQFDDDSMFAQFVRPAKDAASPEAVRFMQRLGFADPDEAALVLGRVCRIGEEGAAAAYESDDEPPWFASMTRVLREVPLRDQVLQTILAFVKSARSTFDPFVLFEQSPRSLELLARVACGSPFLLQTVLAEPESLRLLLDESRTAEVKSREDFIRTVRGSVGALTRRPERLAAMRAVHHRELLRIGLCDAFGLLDLRFVTLQLSLLADAMVQICLEEAAAECDLPPEELAVIALGKLGGEELNYSSDIDLVIVAETANAAVQRMARLMVDGLSDSAPTGFLYRVDLRLRPWGNAGPLVSTVPSYCDYLSLHAETWEKQALLKARCIAGSPEIGGDFLQQIRPLLFTQSATEARNSIRAMKTRIEDRLRQRGRLETEVKLGVGSIRDIEFVVQYLQLVHGHREPRVVRSNTLDALVRLTEFGVMESAWYQQLRAGYVFFRSVEHALQLLHNQQTHELPQDDQQREWLANRLDYPDADTLMKRFDEHRTTVRRIFEQCVGDLSRDAGGRGNVRPDSVGSSTTEVPEISRSLPDEDFDSEVPTPQTPNLPKTESAGGLFEPAVLRCAEDMLQRVSGTTPFVVQAEGAPDSEGLVRLILCGEEYPGWFSDVCGLLTLHDLDIRSGITISDASRVVTSTTAARGRTLTALFVRFNQPSSTTLQNDHALRQALQGEFVRLVRQIQCGQGEAARAQLLESFCQQRRTAPVSSGSSSSLQIEVVDVPGSDHLQVIAEGVDSPGVLYELANTFRISLFRIRDAQLGSREERFRNLLTLTEADGSPIRSAERREELRTTVRLIRRFMRWIPTASEPDQALQRFRDLLGQLQGAGSWQAHAASLQRPEVLAVMAQVLGISPYFWEEFLRQRFAQLLPVLEEIAQGSVTGTSRPSLADQLEALVRDCPTAEAARAAVNAFKDENLFRIDLRFVLGRTKPFGVFSQELTELAEVVVLRMARIAWDNLCAQHGVPRTDAEESCPWTIAALGKFGGVEMGFASDIELILIYGDSGRTSGAKSITNAAFFDLLIGQIATGLAARHDGIFHVDLRMRPHGRAGSPAVSVSDFCEYYSGDGAAWAYERQSLVKLRCVGGDVAIRERVQSAVRSALYSGASFDFPSMRAMRERQVRQLVRGGRINAKLSEGALVDCEYAVQALQITFGHLHPSMQTTSTLQALDAAAVLGFISPDCHRGVRETYIFLRDLIDCLRLERGLARDLTVPLEGTRSYERLQHRLSRVQANTVSLSELPERLRQIRQFSWDVQHHCRSLRSRLEFESLPKPVTLRKRTY